MTSSQKRKRLPYLLPPRPSVESVRIARETHAAAWGVAGLTLSIAMMLGLTSLTLANLTLKFQKERALLGERIERLARDINVLDLEVAKRQASASINVEAEKLGLVLTDKVLFYEEQVGQLTCGELCRTARQ